MTRLALSNGPRTWRRSHDLEGGHSLGIPRNCPCASVHECPRNRVRYMLRVEGRYSDDPNAHRVQHLSARLYLGDI